MTNASAPKHEPWCEDTLFGDYDYVPCTCGLEERLAQWRQQNRLSNAVALPRAVATYRR